ncbi:hypothetical protein IWQ57_003539 [Coemansia nantahalensis]|uniref:Uncharacterized protein n=1 Tax=Coemansia nantahalensis TaxID=2789366 RepID=A0ACC1JWE9_9FUNG|nr:hypothetical protein IWQ57_003539 [Coemansia nantahalensis]
MDPNYSYGYGGAHQPHPDHGYAAQGYAAQGYPAQGHPFQGHQPPPPPPPPQQQQRGYESYTGQTQGNAHPRDNYASSAYGGPQSEHGSEAAAYDQEQRDKDGRYDYYHGRPNKENPYRHRDDDNETTDRGIKDAFTKKTVDEYGTETSKLDGRKLALVGAAALVAGFATQKYLKKRKAQKELEMQLPVQSSAYVPAAAYRSETVVNQESYNPYHDSKL